MKIEEAISHYKYGISHDIFQSPVTEYAQMAVEALEKQMPKEPVVDPESLLGIYCCPNCKKEIVGQINDTKRIPIRHCNECGQAISE